MKKNVFVPALLLFLLFGCGLFSQEDHRHQNFPPETYERAGRDEYQKPDEVVKALEIKPEHSVADIGAGSGYFTRRIAAVASAGTVYAIDIDEEMLRHIHKEKEKLKLHNVVTVLADPHDPMLAPDSVDLVFVCNTLHHITERPEYYKKIAQVLKDGGRFAIVDYHKRDLPVGPPSDEKLSKEEVMKEITAAGFKLQQEFDFLPYQYFLVFQ